MSNKYIDEHLNRDSLSNLGDIYSVSTGNKNPKIYTVGVPVSDNKTLSLKLGSGGTFPVLNESVINIPTGRDYLSMDIYAHNDVFDAADTMSPVDKYVNLVDKYMKQRQSFMIDVNSYNSQGMVMMSEAKAILARKVSEGGVEDMGVKKLNYAPVDFSELSVGLSTFQVAKISREKTIISFNKDGHLSLVLDMTGFSSGFKGTIEYEVTDNNKSIEDVLYRKNIIITGEDSGLYFHRVPEQNFIDSVKISSFGDIAELMASESITPISIEDEIMMHGDNFVLNKTSKCIRIILEDGETHSLNPYAVIPVVGSKIETVIIFKESFVKPSSLKYIGVKTTLYPINNMPITAIDGKFIERAGKVLVDIDGSSATIIGDNERLPKYFGQYEISIDIEDENASLHQFGDNDSPIRAIKLGSRYLYFSGGSTFIKNETDVNFTEVFLPVERNNEGKRSIEVAGVTFSSEYDTLLGEVTKDSFFMYEMNYIISEDSIESEIVGDIYPVGFYRIDYLNPSCVGGSLPDFPMETGHTTSKNIYTAGEVSLILSKSDGVIGISNAKYTNANTITYSYLSAFSKWSDTPFIVESFGYVSKDTMNQSQEDHFLSVRLNSIEEARSKRTYCGSIEKIDSDYIVSWLKVRSIDQSESFLFCENEYRNEIQQHLGHSHFLNPGIDCDTPSPKINKLTYISNPFEYKTGMINMGKGLAVGDPSMHGFTTNVVIDSYYDNHKANAGIKSENTVDGFGINTLSVQNNTIASLTYTSAAPETIGLSSYLSSDFFIVTIPEIGFIHYATEDRYGNMNIISKTQIKEEFERGIKYQFDGFYITGKIKWDPEVGANTAEYLLFDELDNDYSRSYSLFFPDSLDQSHAAPDPDENYDPYDIVAIYRRKREVDELRMIPMYLANTLYSEFGFVQNILGIWDESSGVLIDDNDITLTKTPIESGFQITANCSGSEPMFFMDHYVTMSVYDFGIPYRISREVRLSIIRSNLLTKFSKEEMIEAENLSSIGDKNGASRVTMNGYIKNFLPSEDDKDIRIEFSPAVFYPQGPWQNPEVYANTEDIIMQDRTYTIELMPYSRVVIDLSVTSGNVVRFSHPAKRFSEVYSIVDGFVKRETLSNEKRESRQRGNYTYSMEYVHHVGGGVNLKRDTYGDLLLYPARYSYPINNLIRELISPIREDAHAKAMDARAIFSRFDTRYVSNTIPSYYDKFLEFPTAFTCDALPEEAVLLRGFSNIESLYIEDLMLIKGDDILGDGGIAKVSFSNNTDQVIPLSISYDNDKWGIGTTSFDINDAYSLQRDGWLVYEPHVNKRIGREKNGVFLEGTMI